MDFFKWENPNSIESTNQKSTHQTDQGSLFQFFLV